MTRTPPSIARRIFFWIAAGGIVPLLVLAVQGYYWAAHTLVRHEASQLNGLLESRLSCVKGVSTNLGKDFATAGRSSCAQGECAGHEPPPGQREPVCHMLGALAARSEFYEAMAVFNRDWSVRVQAAGAADVEPPPAQLRAAAERSREAVISNEVFFGNTGAYTLAVQGFFGPEGLPEYFAMAKLNLSRAAAHVVRKGNGHGETGKLYVLSRDGRCIAPPPGAQHLIGAKAPVPDAFVSRTGQEVLRYHDWRGVPVVGAAAWFPELAWIVVAETDEAEVFAFLKYLVASGSVTGFAALGAVLLLAVRSSRRIAHPLKELARVARSFSRGEREERVPLFEDRETREVGEAFNHLLNQLAVSEHKAARSASLAAVGEVSSSIVHEMRNPLSTIRINLQGLGRKLGGDPIGAELAHIGLEQATRLETMLAELLDYGKPLQLRMQPTRLDRLAEEAVAFVGVEAAEKGITIQVGDSFGEAVLEVDAELMARALTNLVINAVQWSAAGGAVVLEASACPEGGAWFCVSVRDSGPGIAADHAGRLFQPFFTTRRGGTGLGLANVRKIAAHHGGTVYAENGPAGGAVFTIQLPR